MNNHVGKTEAIKLFLEANAPEDLAALYHHDLEVQVNVLPDGEHVEGQTEDGRPWHGWTDGVTVWKHIRIPWFKDGKPEFVDSEMRFDLSAHAECIGMTGWDWKEMTSQWVGFDFDALLGHVKGLTDAELQQIVETCSKVPWVTVRRSKSGKGLHLYVFFTTPVPTGSRSEHAALARAVLGLLAAATGLDLQSQVDKLGGNLWVWHREAKASGLSLISQGSPLDPSLLPPHWRDHVDVVEGRRTKVVLRGVDDPDHLDDLVGKTKATSLDEEHRRLLAWFTRQSGKALWWWDQDRHMLVCHTSDLLAAHQELQLRGLFYTNAKSGRNSGFQNCFAFPLKRGGWVVRRHGTGTQEHPAWTRDAAGWTKILLNCPAELPSAAAAHQATESAKGEFVFPEVKHAVQALKDLGATSIPEHNGAIRLRQATLTRHKDGRLLYTIKREPQDQPMLGWLPNKKGDRWETLVTLGEVTGDEVEPPDELVRHCVSAGCEAGWFVWSRGMWIEESRQNASSVMLATGVPRQEIDLMLGQAILNHWQLVVMPFEAEFPGNRRWNKNSARLAVTPKEGPHPTWTSVLNHCGHALTTPVKDHAWCKRAGITTGGAYLLHWVASMIQFPFEPLPYLFFWSYEQNTGKSTFHEALSELFLPIQGTKEKRRGYIKADQALTSQGRFNAELEGQVLCVVEETNLRAHQSAYDRIKDWVTGRTILIHPKGWTPYDAANTTHWVQCANKPDHCPILPGDTRITMLQVFPLEQEIEKPELMAMLVAEAPAFLHTVRSLEIPKSTGRLRVPIINTLDKKFQEDNNRSELEIFLEETTYRVAGACVKFEDLYDRFMESLRAERRGYWTKKRFSRELPPDIPKGRWGHGGSVHLGNITFDEKLQPRGKRFIVHEDKLVEV